MHDLTISQQPRAWSRSSTKSYLRKMADGSTQSGYLQSNQSQQSNVVSAHQSHI